MLDTWLNEPKTWSIDSDSLTVTTDAETDFWSRTFYGFIHDNGHFRYCHVESDFSASVTVSAEYSHLYDQAGLMLMVDSENWLKCGIEFTDGELHFSTVVTRGGFSDWAQQRVQRSAAQGIAIRLTRHDEALRAQYKLEEQSWIMARLAMLPMGRNVKVGVMCCTPLRQGLRVEFRKFRLEGAIPRVLHE